MRNRLLLVLALLPALVLALPGMAQQLGAADINLNDDDIYAASLKALTVLLVVAILIENALALIFNWRVFRAYFSVSGLKAVISFVVSLIVVIQFKLDIMSSLLAAYGDAPVVEGSNNIGTEILTALIVAGGSAGVHNLMRAMGYRGEADAEERLPPKDRAWVAVRVRRKAGVGALQVTVTEDPSAPATLPAMAGTVMAARPNLLSLLMRSNDRFPQNGGYEVVPGKAYRLSVIGRDRDGARVVVPVSEEPVKLAPRAIVDFDVTF